jgi:predicted enzyme related to lactoylglutathione lyase
MTVGLRHAPLLYVFLDIAGLDDERALLEDIAGLPVIEIEKHQPHERHGVVKYDAGPLILSLNLSTPAKFRDDVSDGLVTVMDVDADSPAFQRFGPRLTDPWGHHFELRPRAVAAGPPTVAELRLVVADLDASLAFYGDRLGLELLEAGARGARLATGSADLVLRAAETAVDGRRADHRTVLIVFHAAGIEDVREGLVERGVVFDNRRVAYSKIGGTTRFTDPSGHRFCLYEPSADSLGWGSGPKVIEVAALGAAAS